MSELNRKQIFKDTFSMAWPSVVEGVLVVLAGMVDTYMVSSLGRATVSAVGITNQPKYFVFSAFFAINIAISLLIARRVGEKRRDVANSLFVTGLIFVIAASIFFSVICLIFAEPLMVFNGANDDSKEIAARYFRIVMGGSIFNILSLYINAAQRGSGRTRISMITNVTSNVVNVILNYLLIGGHLGFPALGADGAAIATVLGTLVACVLSVMSLFRKDSYVNIGFIIKEKVKASMENAKVLAKTGITILGELLLTRIGFIANSILAAKLGTDENAAHLVGMSFMNLGFGFGDGLQAASVALVGRSMGEKNIDKAKSYVKCGQGMGLGIAFIISIVILVFRRQIYNAYYPGVEHMILMGEMICMFIAVIMPIQVCKIVFNGALRGAGDVKYTLFGSTIGVTLIQPALTHVLIRFFDLGLTGVWIGILVSQAMQLILFGVRFYSGKWKDKKI
ncbi:putative efflux protein, MATE family [Ruminococcaceae bacterium YRB3002]|nr:putative efflux protein, MATE family [Ruminococcaceae bacterium YRB3002]